MYDRRPDKKKRAPAWCDRVLWRTAAHAASLGTANINSPQTTTNGTGTKGSHTLASSSHCETVRTDGDRPLFYGPVASACKSDHLPVAFVADIIVSRFDAAAFTAICASDLVELLTQSQKTPPPLATKEQIDVPVGRRTRPLSAVGRDNSSRATLRMSCYPPALRGIIEKLPDAASFSPSPAKPTAASSISSSGCYRLRWNVELLSHAAGYARHIHRGTTTTGGSVPFSLGLEELNRETSVGSIAEDDRPSQEEPSPLLSPLPPPLPQPLPHTDASSWAASENSPGAISFRIDEQTVPSWLTVHPDKGNNVAKPEEHEAATLGKTDDKHKADHFASTQSKTSGGIGAPSTHGWPAHGPTFVAETEPLTADLFRTHQVNNFLRAVVVVRVWKHREQGGVVRMPDLLLPICVEYKRPIKLIMSAIPPSHAAGSVSHRKSATNLMGRRVTDGRGPAGGGQFHLRNSTALQDGDTNLSSSSRQPSALYFPSAAALRKTITKAASLHDRNNDSNNGSVENSEAVVF